jgi:hypothetical protein
MPYFYDPMQQAALQHQQWGAVGSAMFNPAMSQAYGHPFGQLGQQFGQPNVSAFWPTAWGMQPTWQPIAQQYWQQQPWQQRQLTQQDVGDVVRQLVPLLPQILAQAQPATPGTMGYGYGQRSLTQQDINEVVRQILPIVPQVAAALQGHAPAAAIQASYGAFGLQNPWAQNLFAQNPWAQATVPAQNPVAVPPLLQQPFGQPGWPQFQSAFGGLPYWNPQQRTLTQNDVNEVARQLVAIIPQAIANLQTLNQQRVI